MPYTPKSKADFSSYNKFHFITRNKETKRDGKIQEKSKNKSKRQTANIILKKGKALRKPQGSALNKQTIKSDSHHQ
jgi:hypothetical protein